MQKKKKKNNKTQNISIREIQYNSGCGQSISCLHRMPIFKKALHPACVW
jgi:hypothetical protein